MLGHCHEGMLGPLTMGIDAQIPAVPRLGPKMLAFILEASIDGPSIFGALTEGTDA